MRTIDRTSLNAFCQSQEDVWPTVAAQVSEWLQQQGAQARDAVVLVPLLQHLSEARSAFASSNGWLPRIETVQTLAESLGPRAAGVEGQLSFDATTDALTAELLLRGQAWGQRWAQRNPRGFAQAVEAVCSTAQAMALAIAAMPPEARQAHADKARDLLQPTSGPGASERALARIAFEWASLSTSHHTDRLFALREVSAWVVIEAGGARALDSALLMHTQAPSLTVMLDPPLDDLFIALRNQTATPALAICEGFEDEAQATAAQVLAHVSRNELPVALVAEDRLLMRRVRALLERHAVVLHDETGWKLSTTRAAASVVSLLRSAASGALTDDLLNWLKAALPNAPVVEALDSACRQGRCGRVHALGTAKLSTDVARLHADAMAALQPLRAERWLDLNAWLIALGQALGAFGLLEALRQDDAGAQVLTALHLAPEPRLIGQWQRAAQSHRLDLNAFTAWLETTLERATFRPPMPRGKQVEVVIAPLASLVLRPFAAVVFAGADDSHLSPAVPPHRLLSGASAQALGLPDAAQQRERQALLFAHVVSRPKVTLLRRRFDGAEPLANSPLVEQLALALADRGAAFSTWQDPRESIELAATPIVMPKPSAPGLLPARFSASAYESLRTCPYRFFALYMLRLREDEELEREIDKRDYGTWLHDVLNVFHQQRQAPAPKPTEVDQLMAIAVECQTRHDLSEADFLPFIASFERFAPAYVEWLHQRDAKGLQWLQGEVELKRPLDANQHSFELHGIVDRIDQSGPALEVIDYKTGGAQALREKVKVPFEDTQLAVYAALVMAQRDEPLQASYLALDGNKGIERIEHIAVEDSARALVQGLRVDLSRLHAGAGLPALGEGEICEHCTARGLCRRDHWASPS